MAALIQERNRLGLALASVIIALAGCHGAPANPVALPPPVIADNVQQFADGKGRIVPGSARVEPGVLYAFRLYTHCGIPPHVFDFDGSFWQAAGPTSDGTGNPPAGLGNPFDDGTITLRGANEAVFRSAGGIEIQLTRAPDRSFEIILCA